MPSNRFPKDDPLHDLHVPKRQRLDTDEGPESDAIDVETGADDSFNREQVRNRGNVVDESDLQ